MKREQVDLENWVVHIADSKTNKGIGDMPMTALAREAFERQIDGNTRERVPVSQPQKGSQALHHELAEGLARDPKESRGGVFHAVRTPAHVCDQTKRGRSRRSHGDADATAGRRGGVQGVQPRETRDDARGAGEAGPFGERARNFEHRAGKLSNFMHISWHTRFNLHDGEA